MPRNNEDFAQGKGIMSNINDSMEMLDGFVSKYTPNARRRAAEDSGQDNIDFFNARVRQDALEEAQEELESASGERRDRQD